ncbi:MAG: hypothetical protein GY864_12255, partial [Desulfobacterales bacterium]|nr:hypothetical protein [Desulfobacterales bacterium]
MGSINYLEGTSYQVVMDFSNMIWIILGYGIHLVLLMTQCCLAGFLILSGVIDFFFSDLDNRWLRRLGLTTQEPRDKRNRYGTVKLILASMILLPSVTGVSFIISALACLLSLIFFIYLEKVTLSPFKKQGVLIRYTIIFVCLFCFGSISFERKDNIDFGLEILQKAQHYRVAELTWQLESDKKSPKVGDMAPDFELSDPDGTRRVRLSEFRGKKPVALIF